MPYNVLIVEDQMMPRQLLEIFIGSSEQYTLAASISNAALAIKFCRNQKIDLILMDVMTEFGESGLDASEEIKRNSRTSKSSLLPVCRKPPGLTGQEKSA